MSNDCDSTQSWLLSLGAAALGARAAGTELPYDYGSHTQEVFHARFTQQAQS